MPYTDLGKDIMKKILFIVLVNMFLIFGAAFSSTSNLYAKTPYEVLTTALKSHHFDTSEVTLETVLPDSILQFIMPELKKAFQVNQEVSISKNDNVSEILTAMMQAKYLGKSDMKTDFYKIQYSLHSEDFARYLKKYPKSKFAKEAESKFLCTQQHEALLDAVKNGGRSAYEAYARNYNQKSLCKYEGYEAISQSDNAQIQAIEAWLTLLKSEDTTDCTVFSNYLDTYGAFSVLANEAKNRLNLCLDQNAWQQTLEQGTIKAYQSYVDKYPNGRHSNQAQRKIADWTSWQTAREKNSYFGYLEYYKNFPKGDSVALAQKELIPNEASAVDLGLPSGTRWAPCNVGAISPEENGDYYAWGETQTKVFYSWGNYNYFTDKNGNKKPWTIVDGKAKTDLGELKDIGNDISGTIYDVAHVKWGGDWKMPTKAQCQELVDKCKWTWWVTQDLQKGYKVTGPNGNSIFLPAAGFRDEEMEVARAGFRGGYWTSTRDEVTYQNSYLLRFKEYDAYGLNPVLHDVFANSLRYGRSVRPVTNVKSIQQTLEHAKQMPSFPIEINIIENTPVINISGHNAVDLGLPSGTKWADCNIGASSPIDYGDYFAWGETQTKRSYAWKTYKYIIDKNKNGIDDYGEDGYKDIGTDISGTIYDVAHLKWGGSWKMPNEKQWKELKDCCTWTATAWKGRIGYKVTGPNGRAIFLPAAGYIWETEGKEIGQAGEYWFATPSNHCNMLSFDVDRNRIYIAGRAEFAGLTVRPVTEE